MNELLNRSTYLNQNILFLISRYIREYDMEKSNISILRYKGVISETQYNYYAGLPKQERQIQIGLLQRQNKYIIDILREGMTEIRNKFIESNNLSIDNVLSIKNDAVFIINDIPKITNFNGVIFREKNTYTSYYRIKNLELYYYYNKYTLEEKLDVKGISDRILTLHQDYFLDMMKTIFCSSQEEDIKETINLMSIIYEKYVRRELNIEYYREFNPESKIKLNISGFYYLADFLSEEDKSYIDISYNLSIIRELLSYYSSMI